MLAAYYRLAAIYPSQQKTTPTSLLSTKLVYYG